MILVTGATGFVGRTLVPRLVDVGEEVRCLIRPSKTTPHLPRGVPVQVAVASLDEYRGIRAALVGVDTVIHLAGAEWHGAQSQLMAVDYNGSRRLLDAALEAGVQRIVYLSHIGADRASAFAVQKVKGLIEEFIRRSGIPHTIIRSTLAFGPEDSFTNALALLLHLLPGIFPLPGDGQIRLQPLWIEDLVTCIEWCLDDPGYVNQTYSIGGPEFLTLAQIVNLVMERSGARRTIIPVPAPYARAVLRFVERALPRWPLHSRWLDYIAVNRTCELHSLTRFFGLRPARFEHKIDYLADRNWRSELAGLFRARNNGNL